jgi:hypothetical protein
MKQTLLVVLVLAALSAAAWLALRGESGARRGDAVEDTLARERAAAAFARRDFARAREELAPLVAAREPRLEDLVRAAAVEHADRESGAPEAALERLRARDPEHPALHYMLARRRLEVSDVAGAIEHYRAALRRAPDDAATQVGLAVALADLGQGDEARELLRGVLARGFDGAGQWYVQAALALRRLAEQGDDAAGAQHFGDLAAQLAALGHRPASPDQLDAGTLAVVLPPRPEAFEPELAPRMPQFVREAAILPELAGARELHVVDVDGDGDGDLLAAGPRGVQCALRAGAGWRVESVTDLPCERVLPFDLGNDDTLDLLVCRGSELLLFEALGGAKRLLADSGLSGAAAAHWSSTPRVLATLPAPPADVLLLDFDHEGDLDVLAVGPFGARLLRNDGAAERVAADGTRTRGGFTDATALLGPQDGAAFTWCASEDLDGDQDVDLLLGGPGALRVLDSRRSEGFAEIGERLFGAGVSLAREPLLADLDGDARPDLFEPGEPARLWMQREDGAFEPRASALDVPAGASPIDVDIDLDGTLDVLWSGPTGLEGALALGHAAELRASIPGSAAGPVAWGDLDRDHDVDLALCGPAGVEVLRCAGPTGRAVRLAPHGLKDNRRAVGAVVEVRSRELYRRIYWRGRAVLVGCGPHAQLDVVRITWPNGVVQTALDVAPGDGALLDTDRVLEQSEGLIGSCPFLYAWNGATYGFVTDVLGTTPLGLPMAPGVLVPPDHDEYVLVRGDQLVPRDGVLELQFTEELREVTYLDRVRLDVVDHPVGTEIQPNERFSFPPFPEPHVHTLRDALSPSSAVGSDGLDWTAELARVDDVHAMPFEPLEPQFLGLATPHWLELAFEPERVRDAPRLRLVCTGWFYWTDASVNMASARTPGVAFVPPILQVPGPDGTWVDAGPPVGFPAGKSKTMVIDVTDVLRRDDPRLRLVSTLRLCWDSLRLATDGDDAPIVVTALEPASAVLWPRGFSRALPSERPDQPERFDWDVLSLERRWNQHPGLYTRYGETLPLLEAIDDRFVILGSGDALELRFDARALAPPAAGFVRDYLLFLDGWAKDRDPNTVEALEVEPLPFHGMSGYPYGAGEAFPDTPEHRLWREQWNTRAARTWIAPLSPAREAEWAAAGP